MGDVEIENPFAGAAIGWTFEDHKEHGYQGGTDYDVDPDIDVTAAVDGVAHKLSDSEVAIGYAPSRFVNVRELKSLAGDFPRTVRRGEVIGKTGNVWGGKSRWPHIDRTVNGVRVAFEPAVNVTVSKPAGGGTAIPLNPPTLDLTSGDEEMFQFRKKSGTRWFVHPMLAVKRITAEIWSANAEVGIPTKNGVDNRKAEKFRKAHNARVKPLTPSIGDDLTDDIVQGVLDSLNLDGTLAEQVADAVYDQIAAGGVDISEASVKALASATVAQFGAALTKPVK
jgi:hypothetical protein